MVVCDVATVRARDVSRALLLVPPFGYIRNPMINSSKYKRQRIIKKKTLTKGPNDAYRVVWAFSRRLLVPVLVPVLMLVLVLVLVP